jgi:hypothetical protein
VIALTGMLTGGAVRHGMRAQAEAPGFGLPRWRRIPRPRPVPFAATASSETTQLA